MPREEFVNTDPKYVFFTVTFVSANLDTITKKFAQKQGVNLLFRLYSNMSKILTDVRWVNNPRA